MQVKRFLQYIECLFFSIYSIELEANRVSEGAQDSYNEAKLLAKRILEFLSLLSSTKDPGNRDFATKELIPIVSGLAHSLKSILKWGLKEAIRLESGASTDIFMQFITLLDSGSIFPRYGNDSLDSGAHRECQGCKKPMEDDCWGIASRIWHSGCLKCSICEITYSEKSKDFFLKGNQLMCSRHEELGFDKLRYISRLEQYSYLLVMALKRLCIITNTPFPSNFSVFNF